jgi:hypothetical protein
MWTTSRGRAELRRQLLWGRAAGFGLSWGQCDPRGTVATGDRVVCRFAFDALGSDDLQLGPFVGNTFDFTVENGQITAATMSIPETNGFTETVWNPFAEWVAEHHPQDGALMYADWPATTTPAMGKRSATLWAEHVAEYVEAAGTS